jgi:trimeric autotransporter adhesin
MSAQVTITQLPQAGAITGTELVPIVQNGQTVQTTTAAISASPSQTYRYLTTIQTPQLPNSRALSGGAGIGLTDGGAQSTFQISLNGVSGTLETMGNGFGVNINGTMTPRSITHSGSGIAVTNGDGQSGNPTIYLDGTVGSLANSSGTGFLALPGNGTVSGRTLTATANQIDITNPNGVDGSPTFSIADNAVLPGVEGVTIPSGTTAERPSPANDGEIRYNTDLGLFEGYLSGSWQSFSSGGSGVTSIATGTGLTGGPITSTGTISIANTAVTAGSYGAASKTLTATVNAQGQLTALAETNIAIANTQVSGLGTMSTQNASAVAITGGTVVGASIDNTAIGATTPAAGTFTNVAMTTGTITTAPASANDIVNKSYVDTLAASGIHFHQPVRVESPINLNATYNNGTAGVGATLTNAGTQAALVIDGVTVSVADRVLVYQQTTQTQNGIYVVTDVGSGSTNWILTRSSDADTYVINSANGLSEGSTVFVQEGATGAGETYTCNTSGVITFGTTNITFAQISSAQIYSAGTGLTLSGTQFSITNTAVTSGAYGSASSVGTFSVNAQGQLTAAANATIAIAGTQITSGVVAVANGGTGVSTLTGLAYGNGTSAFTAATGSEVVAVIGSTAVTNATNAANVTTTATSTNSDFFIPFVASSSTGDQGLGVDAGITYNPSTNALTASINGGTF